MRRALLEAAGLFLVALAVLLPAGLILGEMRPPMLVLAFVMPATYYFLSLAFGPLTGKSGRLRGLG